MSFFDPPPPAEPPLPPRLPNLPSWTGPPVNVLGELVEDRISLFRSDEFWIGLEHLRAYPEGFEFRIGMRARRDLSPVAHAMPGGPGLRPPGPTRERVAGGLLFGFKYADGRRLTNTFPLVDIPTPAPQPLLVQVGGYAVGGRASRAYWHFGLPPAGSLTVVVELEAFSVPETRVEVNTNQLLAAAGRAQRLWPADDREMGRGWRPHPFQIRPVFGLEPIEGTGPSDPVAADRDIRTAFERMTNVDGDELVNVEGGDGLAYLIRDLTARMGPMVSEAQQLVDQLTWVSPTEAVVVFSVWLPHGPFITSQRGSAVLVDRRWKVSRATFAGLMARVGVAVPDT